MKNKFGMTVIVIAAASAAVAAGLWLSNAFTPRVVNSYYASVLIPRDVTGVFGPHYWQNGRIFWCGDDSIKSSGDFGKTARVEAQLPSSFRAPARFVSPQVLAGKNSVYVNMDGSYRLILPDFRCWYLCGSQFNSGDLVIGEYGSRIFRIAQASGKTTLLLTKPAETRHFHVTKVDPYTNHIYTGLGDALNRYRGFGVTGIMRSKDEGETWEWLYKTKVGAREIHRQPTAVFFDTEKIYFGTDSAPHGIFTLDRKTDRFEQVFTMSDFLRSWFTVIRKENGSFWALSRSFGDDDFGILWWSLKGVDWKPVQIFSGLPVWLETDATMSLISIGFYEEKKRQPKRNVIVMKMPAPEVMSQWVRNGPNVTIFDRIFRKRIQTPSS